MSSGPDLEKTGAASDENQTSWTPGQRSLSLDIEGPDDRLGYRNVSHAQEGARRFLAIFLLAIFAFEVLFAVTATWLPAYISGENMKVEDLKEIMTLIFGPTIALVGSATGFYFGNKMPGN